MNIPGRGRINKLINFKRALLNKSRFIETVEKLSKFVYEGEICNVNLVSFSSGSTVYDQILSIFSFVKNVGIPKKWIVFSDGTHGKKEIKMLQHFNFIEIKNYFEENENGNFVLKLNSWQEKKFYSYASVEINRTTIFLDSDVLFFQGFDQRILKSVSANNWYLSELNPHFDKKYLDQEFNCQERMNYTNSGFFILNENIDWEKGKLYLQDLTKENVDITHFSEQTAMDIVFKANKLFFLDPRLFSISLEDHFTLSSNINYSELAIRHFVGPIRFRMWQAANKCNYFQ